MDEDPMVDVKKDILQSLNIHQMNHMLFLPEPGMMTVLPPELLAVVRVIVSTSVELKTLHSKQSDPVQGYISIRNEVATISILYRLLKSKLNNLITPRLKLISNNNNSNNNNNEDDDNHYSTEMISSKSICKKWADQYRQGMPFLIIISIIIIVFYFLELILMLK